jgi:hypothetical protein
MIHYYIVYIFQPTKESELTMGDTGKKDKGKRETQKKAAHSPKEKKQMKKDKKNKPLEPVMGKL